MNVEYGVLSGLFFPMNIRKACISDAQPIARILVDSWHFAYSGIMPNDLLSSLSVNSRAESIAKLLQSDAEMWVLHDESNLIGVYEYGVFRDSIDEFHGYGEIYVMYLSPSYIGQGLGTVMMRHCIDLVKRRNFNQIGVWVLEKNSRAIDFYRRFSFAFTGISKTHAKTGLIEHLYALYE